MAASLVCCYISYTQYSHVRVDIFVHTTQVPKNYRYIPLPEASSQFIVLTQQRTGSGWLMHLFASQHPYIRATPSEPLGVCLKLCEFCLIFSRRVASASFILYSFLFKLVELKAKLGRDPKSGGFNNLSQEQFEYLLDQSLVCISL